MCKTLFGMYKDHRDILSQDIIGSVNRLPASKRNIRCYPLYRNGSNAGTATLPASSAAGSVEGSSVVTHIQMLSALLVQVGWSCCACMYLYFGILYAPVYESDHRTLSMVTISIF